MTSTHDKAVRDCADAELRGDAAEALRLHRSVPFFVHSTHGDQLEVLAELGESAPSWMISRWLTLQARRRLWTGGDERPTQRALQFVVPLLYPDHIPWEPMGCDWPEQVLPFIHGRDWVVRQADLYELGALRELVRHHASDALLARADDMNEWSRAPMRALRLETSGPKWPEPVVVTDLRSMELIEVLDLGVGEQLPAGQHLLARLVPSPTSPRPCSPPTCRSMRGWGLSERRWTRRQPTVPILWWRRPSGRRCPWRKRERARPPVDDT